MGGWGVEIEGGSAAFPAKLEPLLLSDRCECESGDFRAIFADFLLSMMSSIAEYTAPRSSFVRRSFSGGAGGWCEGGGCLCVEGSEVEGSEDEGVWFGDVAGSGWGDDSWLDSK